MDTIFTTLVSASLNQPPKYVAATIELLAGGATVPFISRYRKEATGSMDEVMVGAVRDQLKLLTQIAKRKKTILQTIEEQGALKPELKRKIEDCWDLSELEDLYLPFKPKRKTKASIARERGLAPLAGTLMKQEDGAVSRLAERFIKGDVKTQEEALEGARHIMAEWVNESAPARNAMRQLFTREATIGTKLIKGKEEAGAKYRDYFDLSEKLNRCPSHRLLAMRRGEAEEVLRLSIRPEEERAVERLESIFLKRRNEASKEVEKTIKDAYKRLLAPSIETEFRNGSKEKADSSAINVFANNLRQLLLAAPLGPQKVLAIDPGFRTGCKVVVIDEQGDLKHNETIFPHAPQRKIDPAAAKIRFLASAFKIDSIAIGNATAGRETEDFIKKKVGLPNSIQVFMVNEAGASVYSASALARDEFPDFDVTVRGAVSIGRRLMDPLAELVKIDPKSIGVGQYQHDVDQSQLKESLDQVVESCVNQVGVNLNTASKYLLTYVSGLGPKLAATITEHRSQNGPFQRREDLKKVSGLGARAFEQCAGFLRIAEAKNPLDNSAVHPERYSLVKKMAKDLGQPIEKLLGNVELGPSIDLNKYVTTEVGLPTLNDIISELVKPGRDPRGKARTFSFDKDVRSVEDLKVGAVLAGLVTNITNFGAFVDVGVKQDGLVHISQLADRFVSDPNQIVSLGQEVQVKVVEVDLQRKRIQLSMKDLDINA